MRKLAGARHGVVTRTDLLAAGLSHDQVVRRLRDGTLVEIHPSTYAIGGSPATWHQRVAAASAWAEPDGVVSHFTAARLWAFGSTIDDDVHVSVCRKLSAPGIKVHRRYDIRPDELSRKEGIIVTDPTRTLLDLSAYMGIKPLERWMERALNRGLTHFDLLSSRFLRWTRQGKNGAAQWRKLLEARGAVAPTESDFETLFVQLLRDFDLPMPQRQHTIRDKAGFVARVDFAYLDRMIVIEAQSIAWHFNEDAWRSDMERTTNLGRMGWLVLQFTYRDLKERPEWVARIIAEALAARPKFSRVI
ncbi:MAG: hypothetical protein QOG54_1211 [Actinomycetota bacterium]|nr:hypothetical protein [Actinomycetota bacterium]